MSTAIQLPSGSFSGPVPDCSAPQVPQTHLPQRSTRGASKQRRDQINVEIQRLRDLLPLSESIKDRLFQLQVMSLGCIFIRKHRYQTHVVHNLSDSPSITPKGFDICKALKGFMIMMTRNGKMLHVSENASEYLGHSVEEIMCQGDSIYDLVDHRDHSAVQAELSSGPPLSGVFPEERVFLCRLNLARTAKRQLQYHKFILLQGRYIHPSEYYQAYINTPDSIQPIFAAYCQPLINPENAEALSSGNTNVFTSLHFLDMKFKEVDHMCAYHLGYNRENLEGTSWYQILHPAHLPEIAYKHRLLCQEKEGSVLALIRMQTARGDWVWLHTVFAIRVNFNHEIQDGRRIRHVIHCYYQLLSDLEAATLEANSWIYNMRHTYPTAFPSQDSPCSDQDRPISPASPFLIDAFSKSCEQFPTFLKQESLTPNTLMPTPFQLPCDQIKVEIPMKQIPPHLSMFTPESSSPESSASLHSTLFSQPFLPCSTNIEQYSLLDDINSILPASTKEALPELRDELDDFFRQVEQPPESVTPLPPAVAPISNMMSIRHSPNQATNLFKYLGPALFTGTATQPMDLQFGHKSYHMPECAEYSASVDPFLSRKRSWAV